MKNIILLLATLAAISVTACNKDNGSNNPPGTTSVAAVPAACNNPATSWSTCTTGYNVNSYGYYPYNYSNGYYGQGYYPSGYTGYYVPYYSSYSTGGYGCPYGYQPMYTGAYTGYGTGNGTGSGYTCIAVNYMQSYYSSYGYSPYYSSGYIQSCDAYVNNCPGGYTCQAFAGSRMGYCVVGNKY